MYLADTVDAIDLHTAIIHSSPGDIATWAIRAPITRLTMRPGPDRGLTLDSEARGIWPDYTPPGWDGPLQYTVWAGCRIAEQWHLAAFIQMWRTRPSTGAAILQYWNSDWAYDRNRWGAMVQYRPKAGDEMVFLLSAGNARGMQGPTSLRERTNVVKVELPANDDGVFDFTGPPPPPPPPGSALDQLVRVEAEVQRLRVLLEASHGATAANTRATHRFALDVLRATLRDLRESDRFAHRYSAVAQIELIRRLETVRHALDPEIYPLPAGEA